MTMATQRKLPSTHKGSTNLDHACNCRWNVTVVVYGVCVGVLYASGVFNHLEVSQCKAQPLFSWQSSWLCQTQCFHRVIAMAMSTTVTSPWEIATTHDFGPQPKAGKFNEVLWHSENLQTFRILCQRHTYVLDLMLRFGRWGCAPSRSPAL